MAFNVEVAKDGWDIFNIVITAFCGLCSLFLIYKCSAILADRKKKYEHEFNSLNYLVLCINRYIKHLLGILCVINTKGTELNAYFAAQNDEKKFKAAFQIITPPMINFEVRLSDYAFSVKKQPKILDYLLNYIENYSLVVHQIDMINQESYIILDKKVGSNESTQIAARYYIEDYETNNLLKLKFSTCYTLCLLYLLLQTVQKYQNDYKYKGYTRIDFHESIMNKIVEAENFVTKVVGNQSWKNDLQDAELFNNKHNIMQKIFSITNENNHKIIEIFGIKIKLRIDNNANKEGVIMRDNSQFNCENCEKKIKLHYEQFKNSAEDIGRYVSIVSSIFYVSLITVYAQVSSNLTNFNKKFFIINFIISVGFFVLYEIFKMLLEYNDYEEKNKQWKLLFNNKISISELEKNVNIYITKLYKYHVIVWKYIFSITMLSGIAAFISLLWGICKL